MITCWLQILFCNGTNKEFKTRLEISVLAMLFIHKDIINIILKGKVFFLSHSPFFKANF